jgi:glycosyltransferase involved in cell wall biosynthesis
MLDPRCQVIYNGLDPEAFDGPCDEAGVRVEFGLPPGCPLYMHVGRMDPQKNHQRLIAIFAEIAHADPTAYLLLVGLGGNATEQELRHQVVELGIADRVVFAGLRDDVPRLLKAADLLLFPSLWEGLPGAVLEASAAGTPVLGSEIPGVTEIAARLPLVTPLSLERSDHDWGQAARTLAMEGRAEVVRENAVRRFRASVFTIAHCSQAHYAVWQAGREQC